MKRIILAFIAFIILGLSLVLFFVSSNDDPVSINEIIIPIQEALAPEPFEDITIPYLQKREYKSSIGEKTKYSENSSYTSYLTSYKSDGFKVNALLTEPKGEKPEGGWPAIVFIHGYIPPKQYQTTSNYVSYVDFLAKNGFVVLKIDLRGHGTSEGEAGGGYYGSTYVIDALNAYSALQSYALVNPNKIGLWGHSMAGNIVLRSVAVKKTIPAVVIWAGAVYTYEDFREYGIQDNSYRPPSTESESQRRRSELFEKYGQFNSESSFWSKVAPTNYLVDVKTSIQLNHAVNDDVVSVEYSRNLARILSNTSIYYDLQEYSDGGHNISGVSFNKAMQNTANFFKDNL